MQQLLMSIIIGKTNRKSCKVRGGWEQSFSEVNIFATGRVSHNIIKSLHISSTNSILIIIIYYFQSPPPAQAPHEYELGEFGKIGAAENWQHAKTNNLFLFI